VGAAVLLAAAAAAACCIWRRRGGAKQVVAAPRKGSNGTAASGDGTTGSTPKTSGSFGSKPSFPSLLPLSGPGLAGVKQQLVDGGGGTAVVLHLGRGSDDASSSQEEDAATISAGSGGSGRGSGKGLAGPGLLPRFARREGSVGSGGTPGTAHSVLPGAKNPFARCASGEDACLAAAPPYAGVCCIGRGGVCVCVWWHTHAWVRVAAGVWGGCCAVGCCCCVSNFSLHPTLQLPLPLLPACLLPGPQLLPDRLPFFCYFPPSLPPPSSPPCCSVTTLDQAGDHGGDDLFLSYIRSTKVRYIAVVHRCRTCNVAAQHLLKRTAQLRAGMFLPSFPSLMLCIAPFCAAGARRPPRRHNRRRRRWQHRRRPHQPGGGTLSGRT
jgi:hypothetical protein